MVVRVGVVLEMVEGWEGDNGDNEDNEDNGDNEEGYWRSEDDLCQRGRVVEIMRRKVTRNKVTTFSGRLRVRVRVRVKVPIACEADTLSLEEP